MSDFVKDIVNALLDRFVTVVRADASVAVEIKDGEIVATLTVSGKAILEDAPMGVVIGYMDGFINGAAFTQDQVVNELDMILEKEGDNIRA